MNLYMHTPETLAAIYREACVLDVQALKPGNVSLKSPGHGMCAEDFLRSAESSAPAISRAGVSLGERIHRAVVATHRAVHCNTNLGIILLSAPLIQACLDFPGLPLRAGVGRILAGATQQDAEAVYGAIRLASPGGLGELDEHDVAQCARLDLTAAMREAADRDLIARQYSNGFAELFDDIHPFLASALDRSQGAREALADLFLYVLARYPDTHIQRKHGAEVAAEVSRMATVARLTCSREADPEAAAAGISDLDAALKQYGLNPGTSADLCLAGFLIHRLQQQAQPNTGETRSISRTPRPLRAEAPQTATSQQYEGEMKWQ